jgi:hypothetical protein
MCRTHWRGMFKWEVVKHGRDADPHRSCLDHTCVRMSTLTLPRVGLSIAQSRYSRTRRPIRSS